MSRLHRQKLRLRSQQRTDGLIEPAAREVDRDAFQEVGSTHAGARKALELVERHEGSVSDPEPEPQPPAPLPTLESLSPSELAEVRAEIARRHATQRTATPKSSSAGAGGAQNPPL